MAEAIRVYIVDDHPIIRNSLKDILQSENHVIVGESGSVAAARVGIGETRPQVAIIDINLEDRSGLELVDELTKGQPEIGIVIYSMRNNIQSIAEAYKSGAKCYVPKSEDPLEVLDAIQYAAAGKMHFIKGIAERLAEFHSSNRLENPLHDLTDRELEIFIEAARGKDTDWIAKRFEVTPGSIANRLTAIRKKLNVSNQGEMALLAVKYGYIQPEDL